MSLAWHDAAPWPNPRGCAPTLANHKMLEGTIEGRQRCNPDGAVYAFSGHFIGGAAVQYQVSITDLHDHLVGQFKGRLKATPGEEDGNVRAAIELLVRRAVASGDFSRPNLASALRAKRTADHLGCQVEASFVAANTHGWQIVVTIATANRPTTCLFPPKVHAMASMDALDEAIEDAKRWIERSNDCGSSGP